MQSVQKLSRPEEALMLILWSLEKAFLKDIVATYPSPQPSQSSVSTLLRTLERKGFVQHRAYSKTFEYYPEISRQEYLRAYFKDFFGKYFKGSFEDLVRFLQKEFDFELQVPAGMEPVAVADSEADRRQLSLF